MRLWYDCETRSRLSLHTAGTVKYATQAEIIIVTYAVDDGPLRTWDRASGRPCPPDLERAFAGAHEVWAHNAFFDRTIHEMTRHEMPAVPRENWRCMMARQLAHGLPGGLDKGCEIFRVDGDKSKLDGSKYIQLFCKPNKKGEYNDRHTHPKEWAEFLIYAGRDVIAMRELHGLVPQWNYGAATESGQREMALWHLDQDINARGFAVDVGFAEAAIRATTQEKGRLAQRTQELTEDVVQRATQRDMLLGYLLLEYGVSLPDMKADTIERRLDDPELPEHVKELLRIRLRATKASTSKYKRITQMAMGGRMYGTLQFAAANRTGRWGGRGLQPQNLPRPTHKYPEIEAGIEAIRGGWEEVFTDNVMELASSCLRSVIVAAPGKRLVVSDLSNIEGRMTAFIAGEQWKLDAFAAYDRKEGPDLYCVAYGRSFGVDPSTVEDPSDERQIGKVQELALGYQGGVNAFVTMSATYGMDLEELAVKAWGTIPPSALREAMGTWAWATQQKRTLGLSKEVYVVCESLKRLWREAHPEIESLWTQVEEATRNAILNPGAKFKVGPLVFSRAKQWLCIRLPSGRLLCYPMPKVDGGVISYMGVNVYNKKWHRIKTYGGKLVENIVQAASRDVIAEAMPAAECEGYRIVLSVHDELVCETPDTDDFNDRDLSRILATNPTWAAGLPLAAKGATYYRYRK